MYVEEEDCTRQMFNSAPPLPPRTSSHVIQSKVTFKGISIICLCVYYWRDRAVYEELVDYLDKTISISKINYNHLLGLYQLNDKEIEALSEQRTFKTILGCYVLSDLACYICLIIAVLVFFTTNLSKGPSHIVLCVGILYCICEVHLFTFMLLPYSAALPNSTEQLLNHAIPHNPGGLMQMEQRLGCTFDHNLYAANKRRLNPRNTCDPQIESSFIPRFALIALLVLRLLPIVVCALLMAKRTPLSESIAVLVEKLRPAQKKTRLYVKKDHYSSNSGEKKAPQLSHPPRYNNAAYFATSGALGVNSSRSSEISRVDAGDLFSRSPLW
ncbi:hypothetical protein ANCCEY_01826 [Ancylostoma ceylanicum]|uniref:Uncharacterized protein n=1 Tax=Ancylostoma ceylanicum TaxID=53326 RepID=A0A0D6M6G1_9BILA|nr:hypothetical protein ANCCEY_01826 [Ancylostoma ceylanicum]